MSCTLCAVRCVLLLTAGRTGERPRQYPLRMSNTARRFEDLEIYRRSFNHAMEIFWLSNNFPKEEIYSLTSQIRRSSRSVAANISEAWEVRRYEAHFISKLGDSARETSETKNWLMFSKACKYLPDEKADQLFETYDGILKTIRAMIKHSADWCKTAE